MGFMVPACGFSLRSCRISDGVAICSVQKLTAIPLDIPSTVIGIDLTINRISKIKATDFMNLPKVIQLDLSRNDIQKIDGGAFAHMSSLEKINLNNNKLNTLQEGVFEGLSQLTELRMTKNSLKNVSSAAFKPMTSLKLLDLTRNQLKQVDLILQQLPHLQELYVSDNQLTTFQSWELSNSSLGLRYLDLSQNPLGVFNVTADVFPNLVWLTLGGTSRKHRMKFEVRNGTFLRSVSTLDISGLSMALDEVKTLLEMVNSSLTSLKMNGMKLKLSKLIGVSCSIPTLSRLMLRNNYLPTINSDLFQLCVNITELDLRGSKVRNITDDAFKSLRSLMILNLSHNNLSSVPAATRNLPTLQELDLSTCHINRLQCDDFANHTHLRQLNLYQNPIVHLRDCLFKDLQQLSTLKLQTSSLTTLNGAFKKRLPNLKNLSLNGNKITSINSEEFRGLTSLQNLSLHSNQIKKLNKRSFAGLTSLANLKLQQNEITEKQLETGAFDGLINLKRLDLTENKIKYKSSSTRKSPPFSDLPRLEELSVGLQGKRGWSYLPQNFLQGLSNLLSLNCRNMRLKSLRKDIFNFTPQLENLDINSNTLSDLSSELFSPIGNLKSLYLSRNYLKSLDFFTHANLSKLEFLQARMNQYSVFREEVIRSLPALVYVDIKGNSFTCDCDNEWFIQWVINDTQTQVVDAYNFQCNYPPSMKGKLLLNFDMQSCSRDTAFICFVTTTLATLCLMVVPSVYHFMKWQLVYTYYIFLAWLADTKHKNREVPHQYDAFISYNTHDEPWVIQELLPKMEGEQGWRLCLHHRDFEPGKSIIDNITEAIYSSRKTLCVISSGYLESEWCSREIQAASFRLFDEKKDVLILVFLEEIPASKLSSYFRMRKLLKRQTYLSWPRAGEHTGLFWEKLRQALQTGQELDEERFNLTVLDTE
ncbi:toll-like receptor 22 isoform X2 [Salarias fasciatus]|uniref:Toll-like receptor 13 n=2 Tax=Salarias fasciatus TaxID=181472 RepID=A0A672H237_SALFA|nr:toll-like receptor 13 isoform X2 [Salarias fasciatus]